MCRMLGCRYFRELSEVKKSDLVRQTESIKSSMGSEVHQLRSQLAEQCAYTDTLNAQVGGEFVKKLLNKSIQCIAVKCDVVESQCNETYFYDITMAL